MLFLGENQPPSQDSMCIFCQPAMDNYTIVDKNQISRFNLWRPDIGDEMGEM